jgi:hypothetical protein
MGQRTYEDADDEARVVGSSHSATSLSGRLPMATKACFAEVKHEERALSIGQIWIDPKGGFGSRLCGNSVPLPKS